MKKFSLCLTVFAAVSLAVGTAVAQDVGIEELKKEMAAPAGAAVAAPAAPEVKAPAAAEAAPAEAAPKAAPKAVTLDDLLNPAAAVTPAAADAAPAAPAAEAKPAAVEATPEGAPQGSPKSIEQAMKALGTEERQKMAKVLADMEEVRRQERDLAARKSMEAADKAYKQGDYKLALGEYRNAVVKSPNLPAAQAAKARAMERIPECEYEIILALVKDGKTQEALAKAKEAAGRYPKDKRFTKTIDRLSTKPPELPDKPEGDAGMTDVQRQMLVGKRQLANREYDKAVSSFESVLAVEPENREAMRYIKEIGDRQYANNSVERSATAAKMTADVRDAWNPRYKVIKTTRKEDKPLDKPKDEPILAKMDRIIIPEIVFRQANIHDVVEFLNKQSIEGDTQETDPAKKGVNIILHLGGGAGAAVAPKAGSAEEALFGAAPAGGGAAAGGPQIPDITFQARYISLLQALKIITKVAGLKWRVDGSIVMIVRESEAVEEMEIRMYPVEPTFIERVKLAGATPIAGPSTVGGKELTTLQGGELSTGLPDLREYFKNMGVQWPAGSQITYNDAIGKVIVANTADNLAVFEKVLREINVVPKQVEIEARFVEVNETDLQEMGIEWLLNDSWELATKKGGPYAPMTSLQRIQMDANGTSGGFTKGLRYVGLSGSGDITALDGASGTMGKILSVSSVLTNPELSMILHLLQQNGNADLLSAPKVTTRAGAEASIRVVTEYIYPTAFEINGGQINQNNNNNNNANIVQETTVVPSDFATREVGVILTVQPEVSPDGNMINLTMTPNVVTDPTWYQYGSTIRRADGSEQILNMPQPFFHVRTLTTQISIYDGATVVMGGLITEDLKKTNDKIPVLGDIPLLGVLFRSQTERSIKRNLLIFVTARLVDPAGRPLRSSENAEAGAGTKMSPGGTGPAAPIIASPMVTP